MTERPEPDMSALSDALMRLADSLERLAEVAARVRRQVEESPPTDMEGRSQLPSHTWWSDN